MDDNHSQTPPPPALPLFATIAINQTKVTERLSSPPSLSPPSSFVSPPLANCPRSPPSSLQSPPISPPSGKISPPHSQSAIRSSPANRHSLQKKKHASSRRRPLSSCARPFPPASPPNSPFSPPISPPSLLSHKNSDSSNHFLSNSPPQFSSSKSFSSLNLGSLSASLSPNSVSNISETPPVQMGARDFEKQVFFSSFLTSLFI